MTPRPDDEMEAREWAKAHEEKPFDVRWNPAGAYLAGLLAERARGMGNGGCKCGISGGNSIVQCPHGNLVVGYPPAERARGRGTEDDERKRTFIETRRGAHDESAEILSDCWDEARIGMVPAIEVEMARLQERKEFAASIEPVQAKRVAEATKRERDRCAKIVYDAQNYESNQSVAHKILTPSGEGEP